MQTVAYLHLFLAQCNRKQLSTKSVQIVQEIASFDHVLRVAIDGERNHSMGSPMDRTPPQSED